MSARQVVDDDDVVVNEGEVISDITKSETEVVPTPNEEKKASALPEKYSGKTIEDLVRMHQEAEKLIGKQGSELGELRKTHDDFIKASLERQVTNNAPATTSAQAEEEMDFFADPKGTIEKIIEQHPKLRDTEQHYQMLRQERAVEKLKAKFPGFNEIIKEDSFREFCLATPVRQRLAVAADQHGDVEAADELLTLYTQLHPKQEPTKPAPAARRSRPEDMQALPHGAVAAEAPPSANTGKKIYRRADLIKLMQTDPDRYEALQSEIMAAYAENRVR